MNRHLFVRRYLRLNQEKKTFTIVKDKLYEEVGNTYEEALHKLIESIDLLEGKEGVLANDGFPEEFQTEQEKAFYIANYLLATYPFENEEQEQSVNRSIDDVFICQGFYGEIDYKCPRGLVISRINVQDDMVDYIFSPERGRYKGELEKYLYLKECLYKAENETPEWAFCEELVKIQEESITSPYLFTGKLLSFYQTPFANEDLPQSIVEIFRTEHREYLMHIRYYNSKGEIAFPRTILRSSSLRMIYMRLRYKLESIYGQDERISQDYMQYLNELVGKK